MPRRRTRIGRGAFGNYVSPEAHAWEVLQRILSRGHPLTEDAVFLCMWNILRQKGSQVLRNVRQSTNLGGYRYFSFSPDIDLLEVRSNNQVIGYELKGYLKRSRGVAPPVYYEGVGQALAYLVNPTSSPWSSSFNGSIFDHVYIVHPEGTGVEALADLLHRCTPLGLVVVNRKGSKEVVKPKTNPYLNRELQSFFLENISAFSTYTNYRINPIQ